MSRIVKNNADISGQSKIAIIEDMCGYGRCSMTVGLPLIAACGLQACPVPTAIFSNHTAFDSFYRDDLTDRMSDYIKPWKELGLKFEGIMSGYLANVAQVEQVIAFVQSFRKAGTQVVVDPVMGDNGRLYRFIDSAMKAQIRQLVSIADTITPNVTEACALADVEYSEELTLAQLKNIGERLLDMGPANVVITGINMNSYIGNLCVTQASTTLIKRKKTGDNRCGTGDAFTAMLTALLVKGATFEDAVRTTSAFISKAIKKSDELGIDKKNGIAFEAFLNIKY